MSRHGTSKMFGSEPGTGRVLVWFSCGAASALAAKMAVKEYGDRCEVLYCDTFAYEHPDNKRFFDDVQRWLDREIKVIRSDKYEDIFDVFRKTRYLVGTKGARCTGELKRNVRRAYQKPDDVHVIGFTSEESKRVKRLSGNTPETFYDFILHRKGCTKSDCHAALNIAGIEQPAMYRLGYRNNNCIGCVKGQAGYWNKIRKDFPEAFERMALVERELNVAICKKEGRDSDGNRWRERVFLDELPEDQGHYPTEPDISCGVLCVSPEIAEIAA